MATKIKIAFGSVPKDGGTFTFYRNMRPALRKHGIDLRCVSVGKREASLTEPAYVDEGCMLLAENTDDVKKQARAFVEWCEEEQIDIVMAINSVAILSALPQLPKRIRVVARCANAFDEGYRVTMSGRERLTRIVALTPRLRDDLIADYAADPEMIELIPNGIDPKPFSMAGTGLSVLGNSEGESLPADHADARRKNLTAKNANNREDNLEIGESVCRKEAHDAAEEKASTQKQEKDDVPLGNDLAAQDIDPNETPIDELAHHAASLSDPFSSLSSKSVSSVVQNEVPYDEKDFTTRCARGGEAVRDLTAPHLRGSSTKEMNDTLFSQSNLVSQDENQNESGDGKRVSLQPVQSDSESSLSSPVSVSSVCSVVETPEVGTKNQENFQMTEVGGRKSEDGSSPDLKLKHLKPETTADGILQLGFLGRLEHRQKGVLYLPEIVRELKKRKVDFHLRIAGKGRHRDELVKGLQPFIDSGEVELIGALTKDEVPGFLQSIDVYLFTSQFEGCPNALLEAMMAGTAPVAFLIDGITDFVLDHGRTGFIAPMGDCAAFAEQIDRLMNDRKLLGEIKGAARAAALGRFVPEVAAAEYARVFTEVMAAPLPAFEPLPWSKFQIDPVYRQTGFRRFIPKPLKNLIKKILG